MTMRRDPLDDVLREAHRRGLAVLMHPTAGPVFVHASVGPTGVALAWPSRVALSKLDQAPARPATEETGLP